MGERGLISQVPERPSHDGPPWLVSMRTRAVSHLREAGFPGKKHEAWRFTSVREVIDTEFVRSDGSDDVRAFVNARLGAAHGHRVVLTDGHPAIDGTAPDGVIIEAIEAALARDPKALEGVLGHIAPDSEFAALNGALFDGGLLIRIGANVAPDTTLHLVHVASASATPRAAYPRILILVERGAEATVIEEFLTAPAEGRHLVNAVSEIQIADGARLRHLRLTHGEDRAHQIAYLAASLGRDAFFGSHAVTLGGGLSRLEVKVRFTGPGSEATLDGAYHAERREHVDHQVRVEHAAPHCTSHVTYRGLIDGHGQAVFNAVSVADRGASGTSAHQENRNLLLSPDAVIDTKPHLEIDTDDISASHGATIGALDETQLFYLRARGVPEADARDMLTIAFIESILDRIPDAPTLLRAKDAVLHRLGRSREELVA